LTEIYYFWLGTDRHKFEERRRSREAIHRALQDSWLKMRPSEIPNGFDAAHPYTLFHLIFTSDYQKAETVPLGKIDDWTWAAAPLLAAARARPTTMLPQILIAVNEEKNRGGETPRFGFDETRLDKWFGESTDELLELVTHGFDVPNDLGPLERYLIEQAVEKAGQLIKQIPRRKSLRADSELEHTKSVA
jgi:hypothetical protein